MLWGLGLLSLVAIVLIAIALLLTNNSDTSSTDGSASQGKPATILPYYATRTAQVATANAKRDARIAMQRVIVDPNIIANGKLLNGLVGVPAIQPSDLSGPADQQTYTPAEAELYARTHLPREIDLSKGDEISVSCDRFYNGAIVNSSLADPAFPTDKLPEKQLFAMVRIEGTFSMVKPGSANQVITSQVAWQIYDARTGNLLLESLKPSEKLVPPETQFEGGSGITPHLNPNDPNLPTFNKDDVQHYVDGLNQKIGFKLVSSLPLVVDVADFLTVREAIAKYGSTLFANNIEGQPDRLICFTLIKGYFAVGAPNGTSVEIPHAFIVFDARTGNRLLSGGTK
jgi:hypothetical protein